MSAELNIPNMDIQFSTVMCCYIGNSLLPIM